MTQDMRETGRQGGRAPRRTRLTLGKVQRELGLLVTVQDAQRRLDVLMRWSAAGVMTAGLASAAVRACEVWIRGEESRASFEEVGKLRDALAQVIAERDVARAELERASKRMDFAGTRLG